MAVLPANLSGRLTCPVFAVEPGLGCWGQWQGGIRRCITLNEQLLMRHPWYAVRDVLRHEIAHHIVDECGLGPGEKPHGSAFRAICKLISARPEASGDYPVLDEMLFADDDGHAEGADTPQARMLVKIRKLLALSHSPDQHEAEAALLKAREMADKYDLELVENGSAEGDGGDFFRISVGPARKRARYEDVMVANILKNFYRVRPMWEFVPDEESGTFMSQLALCGTRSNLRVASYVYDCIHSYMDTAARELPMELFCKVMRSKKAMEDFRVGILQGFMSALQEQPEPEEVRALVLARQVKLDEYFTQLYPGQRKMRRGHRVVDAGMVAAGDKAGRKLRIHPGMEKGGSGRRQLTAGGKV